MKKKQMLKDFTKGKAKDSAEVMMAGILEGFPDEVLELLNK